MKKTFYVHHLDRGPTQPPVTKREHSWILPVGRMIMQGAEPIVVNENTIGRYLDQTFWDNMVRRPSG